MHNNHVIFVIYCPKICCKSYKNLIKKSRKYFLFQSIITITMPVYVVARLPEVTSEIPKLVKVPSQDLLSFPPLCFSPVPSQDRVLTQKIKTNKVSEVPR